MNMARNISEQLLIWRREAIGSVAPMMAMSTMAIVSLGGAALALGLDSRAASNLQMTADFAALSGATAFVSANSPRLEDRIADAKNSVAASVSANAGYAVRNLEIGAIVEDPYGQHAKIDVALAFEPANPAAKVAGRTAGISIERRATASATWGFPLCVLGLSQSGTGFGLQDDAALTAKNCVVWTNAKSSESMSLTGGTGTAKYFCAGGRAASSGAQMAPRPHENCNPIPDPLASWVAPPPGPVISGGEYSIKGFDSFLSVIAGILQSVVDRSIIEGRASTTSEAIEQMEEFLIRVSGTLLDSNRRFTFGPAKGLTLLEVLQVGGAIDNVDDDIYESDSYSALPTMTLAPGTYEGLDIDKGHVQLQPGIYHILNGPLIVRRRATLTGEGVTIILVGDRATFSVVDEARLALTAPETGDTAGFALAEDRRRTLKKSDLLRSRLTGSGRVNMIGTIYLPRQQLSITGEGAADQSSPLLQIVADNLDMANHGALEIDFDPSATRVPVTIKAAREARLDH